MRETECLMDELVCRHISLESDVDAFDIKGPGALCRTVVDIENDCGVTDFDM
jgi:hypothetical protein